MQCFYLQYMFECGSGPATLRITPRVNDGKWHHVNLERNGKSQSTLHPLPKPEYVPHDQVLSKIKQWSYTGIVHYNIPCRIRLTSLAPACYVMIEDTQSIVKILSTTNLKLLQCQLNRIFFAFSQETSRSWSLTQRSQQIRKADVVQKS